MNVVTPAQRARRGRPPAGAGRLSERAIVDAALRIVDRDGLDAISMRNVARLLGVDPKSLYHHIADKSALLDGIAERVLASIAVAEPTGDLRTDVTALATAYRAAVAGTHPQAAVLVLTRPIERLASLAPLEAALQVFVTAGADAQTSVHLLRTTLAVLTGTLLRECALAASLAAADAASAADRRRALEATGLSAVVSAAPHLAACDHDAEFAFTLEFVLAGIKAALRRPTP